MTPSLSHRRRVRLLTDNRRATAASVRRSRAARFATIAIRRIITSRSYDDQTLLVTNLLEGQGSDSFRELCRWDDGEERRQVREKVVCPQRSVDDLDAGRCVARNLTIGCHKLEVFGRSLGNQSSVEGILMDLR
jgi:hypothetical protein